jgi:hypothetical protein
MTEKGADKTASASSDEGANDSQDLVQLVRLDQQRSKREVERARDQQGKQPAPLQEAKRSEIDTQGSVAAE